MTYRIEIPMIGAALAWLQAARGLLAAGVPPGHISWQAPDSAPDLFGGQTRAPEGKPITVSRRFVRMANTVVWHRDPERFARLYRLLWRLQKEPYLIGDHGDPEFAHLRRMEKNVHRCQHKMKAFVRFREIGNPQAARRSFAAWFEPTHFTLEPTADFFMRRFGDMDWRIMTPDATAYFIDGHLTLSEGRQRPDLPDDAQEALWITYFQSIFNPARLKVAAMQSEMPRKYWHNLPEAAAISQMVQTAQERAQEMARAAPTLPPLRAEKILARSARQRTDAEDDTTVLE
ncbi:hypothetical protein ROLI_039270 [Roseobacter fucihabitans]|uniref:DUF4130 domain-containing protein n=1 Tax=Roseobacter fucihabitans TaxID=1537242 RepID=A0ABZ2BXM3_9RHOB|nr:hypothetical protein [Roseobacter litoralis]